MMETVFFAHRERCDRMVIATLGPAGTSSEQSARAFGHQAVRRLLAPTFEVSLFDSYEAAAHEVVSGRCDALVVANAYAGINEFYMDRRLEILSAFLKDTPNYGIAAVPGDALPGRLRIATHPAPQALIRQLIPADTQVEAVVFKDSTSLAAKAVLDGEVDAALTTEVAAGRYQLAFVSPVRPIRMLWSVFVRNASAPAPGAAIPGAAR